MKKSTWAVCGVAAVAAGYLLAPYIKKAVNWAKKGLISLKEKLDEAAEEEEVPEPEQVMQQEENPED